MTESNKKLDGKVVCLDLSNSIPYKQKKSLIDLIKDDPTSLDTYKCRMGFRRNIPVVGIDYITELLYNSNESINIDSYSLLNVKLEENLKKGYISSRFIEFFFLFKLNY